MGKNNQIMWLKNENKNKGMGLVEIIIAASIISVTLLVLVSVYGSIAQYSLSNVKVLKAAQLVEETVEVLKYLADSGYTRNISTLNNGTTYHPYWNATLSAWTATTSNIQLESKYRIDFVLSAVNRDSGFNVVTSGGTLDTNSRKAVVTVSWREGGATSTKTAEAYIFNVFNN